MKNRTTTPHGLTALVGLVLTTLLGGVLVALVAAPAQAYPEDTCSVSVSSRTVQSGDTLTVSGQASGPRSWSIEWNGTTRSASGSSFSVDFVAPATSSHETIPVHVDSTSSARTSATTVSGCSPTINIEVTASSAAAPGATSGGSGSSGALASTGGPNLAFLVVALLLLVAGAVVVAVTRRRALRQGEPVA